MKRLLNIRLSYVYPTLFVVFLILLTYMQPAKLSPGQLALYSVNTFLFGFYFSPLLGNQKARVDALNRTVRQETMVILDILGQSHLLSAKVRHDLKVRLGAYIADIRHNENISADNRYYDELLRFAKQDNFKNDSVMDTIYGRIARTQENRDTLNNLFGSRVYSHEWLVTLVLFSITMYFIMQTDYNGVLFFRILLAVLLTGVSLMLVILVKYATLTHKAAKRMWEPLDLLLLGHFEDVQVAEVAKLRASLESAKS